MNVLCFGETGKFAGTASLREIKTACTVGAKTLKSKRSFGGLARIAAVLVLAGIVAWGTQDRWLPYLDTMGFAFAPAAEIVSGDAGEKKPAGNAPPRGNIQTVPVLVEAAGEAPDEVTIEAIGTARAVRSVTLYPEVEGEVVALPIQSGQRVKADQVMMKLGDRSATLSVRVAETRVREAKSALIRADKLRQTNVRSPANVEDAEVILERATLELEQAQEDLADRTLRAPFDGIVGIPKIEIGDRVTPTMEIVTLDDRSTLLVEFEVAERYLSRLTLGMALDARTPTFPDRRIDGTVDEIDSRVDPVSRTVLIRAAFPNADDILRPGMSFFVTLVLPGPVMPTVPELALQWRDGASFVWKIDEGTAKRIDVIARRRLNDAVLVEGDITPGDLVVVEGVQRLRNGRHVDISVNRGS